MPPKLCVVGASNIDLISYAPRLPKLGETLPGTRFEQGFGGKGANQAVMAAKLGAQVTFVTKLGDDVFGQQYLERFRDLNFDMTHVTVTDEDATGVAPIWVDEASGDNAIIVNLGANDLLSPADVEAARAAIAVADVLVCQWEIPTATVEAALRTAREVGTTTIFNPAPAREELPDGIIALCDILSPNESETEILTGWAVDSLDDAEAAAQRLIERGARHVILTLGARGSLLVNTEEIAHVPAPQVEAVDTTGAGDAFMGALAYFLASGVEMKEAMRRASAVAAASVQGRGTQSSFPNREDLADELFQD